MGNYEGVINNLINSINSIVPYKFEGICKEFLIYLNNKSSSFSLSKNISIINNKNIEIQISI